MMNAGEVDMKERMLMTRTELGMATGPRSPIPRGEFLH
jgi:hypothetical protein